MSYYIRDVYDVDVSTGEVVHTTRNEWRKFSKRTGVSYSMFMLDGDDDYSLSKCEFYTLKRASREVLPWDDTDASLTLHVTQCEYERWAKEAKNGYTKRSIKNSFMSLVEKGLFVRIKRGYYMINPFVYYKGNMSNITKARNRFEEIAMQAQKDKHQSE